MGFLRTAIRRCGREEDPVQIDTLVMGRAMYPELRKHKLDTLAEHMGVEQKHHHRADDDARVLAEIFRAGVNAVPRGQVEAAQALGLSKAKITFKIVLPQAIRFIIPSLISQLVVVVKDTTVAYVVSYPDLMQNARVLITNYDALVSVYLVIAVIYILINVAINKAAVYVSHKTGATIIR